ncbi:SRPBCC domain-containing protein [Paenibacillus gorillae]|uniref:SRPBCC domain-containing protein n=1 Tax=Paenibacillus gorillae TaxID=1243662 RepID=UPI0004B28799|nr:SRPBCC domain-containing protein [Paenibacillus gorillae]
MTNKLTLRPEGSVLFMEREFDAPRELVYDAYTQAEHLKHWWGPRGWELSYCTVDFRPGGVWHYCMKCVDENQGDFFGFESWGKGVYKEIDAPESFTYQDFFSDAEGNETEGMPSSIVALSFEPLEGNRTRMVSRAKYESEDQLNKVLEMGMEPGIAQTLDRFEEYLLTL